MYRPLFLILLLLPLAAFAQHVVQGRVIDDRSLEPLAFVHVLADGMREGGTTDIDGRFRILVDLPEVLLNFSYVGYTPLRVNVKAGEPVVIRMERTTVELRAVEILPGENPAHRIIEKVHANRRTNDGMNERSHRYTSYSKTIFTAGLDSSMLNDPARMAALDSSDREAIDWLDKQHLLMVESATKKAFIPPAQEREEVLAMRVSGLRDPSLLSMAASTRTFSIYKPQIVLNEKTYVSPIGPGSTEKYLFILQDTLYQGGDSVFVISYGPRKGRKFDALKGVLYVNTDGYALQNVIAEPVERQAGLSLKLQQQFEKIDGRAWFPVQLNTFLYLDFMEVNGWKLIGIGRTYLHGIEVDADVVRKEVRGPELVVEREAVRRENERWGQLRLDSLDEREMRTYHVMDSIGEKYQLDRKLKWLGYLTTGRLPIGPVDLPLDRLFSYNGYEGFRLGAGLATNDRISRYFSLGGYFAYGFADERSKFGGDLVLRPRPGRDLRLKFFYQDDVAESGGVEFPGPRALFSNEGSRMWFVDRMEQVERYGVEAAFRVNSDLKFWIGTQREERWNTMGYVHTEELDKDLLRGSSHFLSGGFTFGMRFALRERLVRLPDREMTIPGKWPVLRVQAYRALPGIWQGELDLWRVNAMLEKTFKLRMLGDLSLRTMAGMAATDAAYPYLFNLRGTYDTRTRLAVANTFETMRPNEFLADRYVSLHVRHSFRNLLFKSRKWRPVPVLVGNAVWGGLERPAAHEGYSFTPLNEGFYEVGLQIDDLITSNLTGLGVGVFMRVGEHRSPVEADNFAFKLSLGLVR